jgi:competence protein ComEA
MLLSTRATLLALVLSLMSGFASAQLPDGPGKQETQKLCSQCHELERSVSLRQDRDGWKTTMNKMASLGAQGTEEEFETAFEYLVRNYPAEQVPKVNVNKATAIELEAGLTLRRSQAAAVIAYRAKNGPFKSLDDLKKVPGLDPAYIDSKKPRLTF